jgi:hypothetical protein
MTLVAVGWLVRGRRVRCDSVECCNARVVVRRQARGPLHERTHRRNIVGTHTDRYIPLHPQLKDLLDDWIIRHRPTGLRTNRPLLERNRPISHHRCGTPWRPKP